MEQPSGSACPLLPGWQQEPSCGRLSPRAAPWARAPCHVPGRKLEEREGRWETAPSQLGAREHPCHLPCHPWAKLPSPRGSPVRGGVGAAEPGGAGAPRGLPGCSSRPVSSPFPGRRWWEEGGVAWPWPPLRCVCHDRSQLRPLRSPIKRRAPRPEPLLGTPAPEEPGCSARAGTDARTQSCPPPPPPGRKGSSQCSPQGWRSQIRLEPEPRPRQAWESLERRAGDPSTAPYTWLRPWSPHKGQEFVYLEGMHCQGAPGPKSRTKGTEHTRQGKEEEERLSPCPGGWRPLEKGSAPLFPLPSAQVPALLRSGAPRLRLHGH